MPDFAQIGNSCGAHSLSYIVEMISGGAAFNPTPEAWHTKVVGADFLRDQKRPPAGVYGTVLFRDNSAQLTSAPIPVPEQHALVAAMKQQIEGQNCNPVSMVESFPLDTWKAEICVLESLKTMVLGAFEKFALTNQGDKKSAHLGAALKLLQVGYNAAIEMKNILEEVDKAAPGRCYASIACVMGEGLHWVSLRKKGMDLQILDSNNPAYCAWTTVSRESLMPLQGQFNAGGAPLMYTGFGILYSQN